MRRALLILATVSVALAACDEGGARSSADPAADPSEDQPDEVVPPRDPSPACASDAECEVVSVACVGEAALHRDRAPARRELWGRRAAIIGCARADWAPPRELHAYCRGGGCVLDMVSWPALRGCAADGECEVIADPCAGPLGVRRDRRDEAQTAIASPERAELCADRREAIALAVADLEESPSRATCRDGFCRP